VVGLKSVEKPCGCKESCGHYAWLEDSRDKDYLEEDLTVKDMDLRKESPDKDTYKHKLFMEGKCIKCKEKIVSIPDSVFTVKGLQEFPLHNFNACNGTLYHIECPKDMISTQSNALIDKSLLLD
jgi:hypothetical protein